MSESFPPPTPGSSSQRTQCTLGEGYPSPSLSVTGLKVTDVPPTGQVWLPILNKPIIIFLTREGFIWAYRLGIQSTVKGKTGWQQQLEAAGRVTPTLREQREANAGAGKAMRGEESVTQKNREWLLGGWSSGSFAQEER